MEAKKDDVTLIGEVWDGPAVVAPYFDRAMSSVFNFELAGNLLSMVGSEAPGNVASRLERIYGLYEEASGGEFVDSIFLANHDQNRVMTVLGGDEGKARVAAALLLTLPGNPFLYYGEELGMQGAKPDEYIREPMPWTKDRTAAGNTRWMTPKHNGAEAVSFEEATADDDSLFRHYQRLIEFRKKDAALRGGALKSLKVGGGLESFLRETDSGDASLVIHNVTGGELSVDLAETEEASGFERLAFATTEAAAVEGTVVKVPAYGSVVMKKQ